MITPEIIQKIGEHIENMEMFKETLNTRPSMENPDDEMFSHTHNAIELFDSVIIQSDYCDNTTNSTEYYIYNPDTDIIREATSEEDEIMRDLDQNDIPFREREDIEFIIARNVDNSISRAKELIKELNDISEQIRTIRDMQDVKPCSDDECHCNVFDIILDDIEEAIGQFRT